MYAWNLIWNLFVLAFVIFDILAPEILDFRYNFQFSSKYYTIFSVNFSMFSIYQPHNITDLHLCISQNFDILSQNVSIYLYRISIYLRRIFQYTCAEFQYTFAEYFNILVHNISIYPCRISICLCRICQYISENFDIEIKFGRGDWKSLNCKPMVGETKFRWKGRKRMKENDGLS